MTAAAIRQSFERTLPAVRVCQACGVIAREGHNGEPCESCGASPFHIIPKRRAA